MKKVLLIVLAAMAWSNWNLVAAADDLAGSWQGPWYRGMTSGTMALDVGTNGEGVIQFTNLDNFGEEAVPITRIESEKAELKFSAAGAGAHSFVATSQLTSSGNVLKGKGEYEGFPIKFKLKRR